MGKSFPDSIWCSWKFGVAFLRGLVSVSESFEKIIVMRGRTPTGPPLLVAHETWLPNIASNSHLLI